MECEQFELQGCWVTVTTHQNEQLRGYLSLSRRGKEGRSPHPMQRRCRQRGRLRGKRYGPLWSGRGVIDRHLAGHDDLHTNEDRQDSA
jgi:hypothetical protein